MYLSDQVTHQISQQFVKSTKTIMKREQQSKNKEQLQTTRKEVGDTVTIGKNVLNKKFVQNWGPIQQPLKNILGKYYMRIQQENIGREIKIGVNGQVKQSLAFVYAFFKNLQHSSMLGYFLLRVEIPLLRQIAGVTYQKLQRLQLSKFKIIYESVAASNLSNHQHGQILTISNPSIFVLIYNQTTKGNNMITTLKPLQKLSFKQFTSIDVDCNFFNECNPFNRMKTINYDPIKNTKFYIFMTENKQHIGNISFLIKMQNVQTSLIGENSSINTYIKQPQVISAIYRLQVQKPKPK